MKKPAVVRGRLQSFESVGLSAGPPHAMVMVVMASGEHEISV
jgi:hypothetical protein